MGFKLAKGVRDFPPEEQILRQRMIWIIRAAFERYGFSPLETPVIERFETLAAKFGAGEGTDVMKEIFRLKDQGGRDLALKFDQTVPLARYIAQNPTIKLPFRRYTIDRSFRDGPLKLGRYREFLQCDADIVGSAKMLAEVEIINLALAVFRDLGLEAYVEINNRKILFSLLKRYGIPDKDLPKAAISIDKIKKVKQQEIVKELASLGMGDAEGFVSLISGTSDIEALTGIIPDDLSELKEVMGFFKGNPDVRLNLGLARGLNYYTGTVIEAFLKDSKVSSSVAGGGRYDEMIGEYAGRGSYPAIGISFGIEPIIEAVKLAGYNARKTVTDVLVIPIQVMDEGIRAAFELRERGINAELDINQKGISKNLKYADYYQIPFVILIGQDEVDAGVVKLRDMASGKEELLKAEDAAVRIKAAKAKSG